MVWESCFRLLILLRQLGQERRAAESIAAGVDIADEVDGGEVEAIFN